MRKQPVAENQASDSCLYHVTRYVTLNMSFFCMTVSLSVKWVNDGTCNIGLFRELNEIIHVVHRKVSKMLAAITTAMERGQIVERSGSLVLGQL